MGSELIALAVATCAMTALATIQALYILIKVPRIEGRVEQLEQSEQHNSTQYPQLTSDPKARSG